MPQRLYLRFLFAKNTVCARVTEFAAYFWRAIPEVRGKYEIYRPDTSFRNPRPAVLLPKIRLCLELFDFPRTSGKALKPSFRKQWIRQTPLGKLPLKRENRLSAVPTDQAERIVARPHHIGYFKEELGVRQSDITNLSDRVLPTGLSLPKKASMHAAHLL
ncbi:hypothetical protein [uncultured Senegalimassilia sp.]|uniref:hypothetical protein n=1 Tax=uncultured Senegalimassilia sp. TaxID=1714350 RepID=UPI0025EEA1E3|nr:hypothetical protein [uncultured Senegalimassilia sp.]